MAKFCENCGNQIDESADICLNCGKLTNKTKPNVSNDSGSGSYNGLAIAGFIVSIVGCTSLSLVAIILSAIALSQIKKTEAKGKGMALAGLIIGILGMVLMIAYIIIMVVVAMNDASESYYYY